MGKLIVTEFTTLDGVAQAPGGPDEDHEGERAYLVLARADGQIMAQREVIVGRNR